MSEPLWTPCLPTRAPYFLADRPRAAYEVGGRALLWREVRAMLREYVAGRGRTPAEVAALRYWIAEETPRTFAYWLGRFERPEAPERPTTKPAGEALPECVRCGESFPAPPPRRGRRRVKCYRCSPPRF